MKPGDLIYRVIKSKYDNKWYYCIYEVIKYDYYNCTKRAYIEIAPIITYYEAKHSSHTTIVFPCFAKYSSHTTIIFPCFEEWKSTWRTPWDYISKDEFSAKAVYKQKIENENQSNNEDASIS